MPPLKNIAGMRFDRLTVISVHGREKFGRATWLCKCDCGKEIIVFSSNLIKGNTKSCGCLKDEKRIDNGHKHLKHGCSKGAIQNEGNPTPEYISWQGMRQRCLNLQHQKYPIYGGRGITICERWSLFENFLMDMGERPEGKTLHRIDNDGDYEPFNCEWADYYTQNKNREFRRNQAQAQA